MPVTYDAQEERPRWRQLLERRAVTVPAVIALVAIASSTVYASYRGSDKPSFERGGDFQLGGSRELAHTDTSSPSPSTGAPGSPSPSAGPAVAPIGSPSASPEESVSPSAAPHSSPSTAPSTAPSPSPSMFGKAVLPTIGTYQLKVAGFETIKRGFYPACTNAFPSSGTLTVSKAEGEQANSFNFDTRLYPNDAAHHDERQIYDYASDGAVTKTYSLATISCGGQRTNSELTFDPAQLRVAPGIKVGSKWTTDSAYGRRTEHGEFNVDHIEEILLGNRVYRAYVVKGLIRLANGQSGTREQTWWWYPPLGMSLKYHVKDDISRSGSKYENDYTMTLSQLPAGFDASVLGGSRARHH